MNRMMNGLCDLKQSGKVTDHTPNPVQGSAFAWLPRHL